MTQGPGALLVFAGIIFLVLFALFCAVRLRTGTRRVIRAVQRARKTVEKVEDSKALPSRFEEVDQRLQEDRFLGAAWRRFSATLLIPHEPSRPIRQTVPAEQFFDASLLRRSGISPRFHAALPNILVGGGLLLTFAGLILALQAAAAVGSTDVAASRHALEGLLRAISIKFYASLCGLGLSILYLIWHRRQLHALDTALAAFCDALTDRMPRVSPLQLAQESNRLLDKQLEAQQRLVNDLVLGLGDRLDRSLDQRLGEQIAPLRAAIEAMAKNLAAMNQGALEAMIERFSSLLTDTAGAQMRQLADAVATMSSQLAALAGAFDGIKEGIVAAGQTAAEDLAATLRAAAADLASRINASSSSLHTLLDRMEAVNAALSAQSAAAEAAASRFHPTALALERSATAAADATTSLTEVAKNLHDLQEALERASAVQSDAHEHAGELARRLSQTTESFSGLDQKIRATFNELQTSLVNVHDRIADFAMRVDGETAKAVNLLSGAIIDLQEVLEDGRSGDAPGNGHGSRGR